MAYPAQNDISDLSDFVTTTKVTITDVVLAVVVLLASWILARLARRGVLKLLGRVAGISEDLRQLAARVTFYFLLMMGIGVAFTFLGAEIQPVITAGIILAVVAALALRGIAENFAAGVLIQTRRPIVIGDDIDVLDHSGIVREINGRSVILEAWDRRQVHIPNRTVLDNPFVNHTAHSTRRSEVEVRLAITDSIDEAVAALVETVVATPGVIATPPPVVLFRSVDPARAVVIVRFAHGPNDAVPVTSAVVRAVAEAERSRGRDATVTAPPPVTALTPPATI
jgi:small-conductance mechanosensitive channel